MPVRTLRHAAVVAALVSTLTGCAHSPARDDESAPGSGSTAVAPAEPAPASPLGSPFAEHESPSAIGTPLLIDRTDMRIGTTVQFRHIPSLTELHDLTQLPGLARVVLSFNTWPHEYAPLQSLNQSPEGVEVVAILNGWPPGRAAVDAWNYLHVPVRIVVIVPGPPPSVDLVQNLNEMRGLERVIAQMDMPSRQGFERLQRPLSFRKLMD